LALQIARRELVLESALTKLDKYNLLILDDIAYVNKDQAETSVLFELIGNRYERRSMLITANQHVIRRAKFGRRLTACQLGLPPLPFALPAQGRHATQMQTKAMRLGTFAEPPYSTFSIIA
jgi:hypothetical protein